MSDDDSSSGSGAICLLPLAILITLIFVILKFTGVIDWGWVAIASPILAWLGLQLLCIGVICVIIIVVIVIVIVALIGVKILERWKSER